MRRPARGGAITGLVVPNVAASALIRRGDASLNLAAGTDRQDTIDEGTDTLTDPRTGELVEFRRKVNHYRPRNPVDFGQFRL